MDEREFRQILVDVRRSLLKRMRDEGFRGATPWDINNEFCDEFADTVVSVVNERHPEERLEGIYMMGFDEDLLHTTILWRGKLYDAECVEGVKLKDWRRLPIVRNKGMDRDEAIQRGAKGC